VEQTALLAHAKRTDRVRPAREGATLVSTPPLGLAPPEAHLSVGIKSMTRLPMTMFGFPSAERIPRRAELQAVIAEGALALPHFASLPVFRFSRKEYRPPSVFGFGRSLLTYINDGWGNPASSASGPTRKSARLNGMSGLPPTADVVGPPRQVRVVPIPDSCSAARSAATQSPRRRGRAWTCCAKTGRFKQNISTDSYGHRRAAYSKCRLACLARRRSIQCAASAPFALKNLRALLATDSNVRHASVAFNQAMAWLYH